MIKYIWNIYEYIFINLCENDKLKIEKLKNSLWKCVFIYTGWMNCKNNNIYYK